MSFRERILWATLIAGIGPYLWYFGAAALAAASGKGISALSIGGLVTVIIIGLIIMIVAVAAVAIWHRRDGSMDPDERERRIESRGFTVSYHLLCTGVILTIAGAWLGWSAIALIHVLAFVFILAEFVRITIEIHGLRRGY